MPQRRFSCNLINLIWFSLLPWKCLGVGARGRSRREAASRSLAAPQRQSSRRTLPSSFECCISRTLLIKRRPRSLPPSNPYSCPYFCPYPCRLRIVAVHCIVCALKVTAKLMPTSKATPTLRLFIGFACCCCYCCCCSSCC